MSFEPIRIGNTVITKKAKSNKTHAYEIKNEASPHLMKSIKASSFEATDVLTLRDYLKRTRYATEMYVALRLAHDLGQQMQALISGGHCFACLGVDDVVVVTHRDSDAFTHKSLPHSTLSDHRMDPQFLFLNDRLLFEVDERDGALLMDRKTATAATASSINAFLSPELVETLKLTTTTTTTTTTHVLRVHFKTAYYSVAQLIIYFLLNVDRIPDDHDAADPEYLRPIKGTKLCWFLMRCLNRVPSDRMYVYI
jgi:hypothetical protein